MAAGSHSALNLMVVCKCEIRRDGTCTWVRPGDDLQTDGFHAQDATVFNGDVLPLTS